MQNVNVADGITTMQNLVRFYCSLITTLLSYQHCGYFVAFGMILV